MDTISDFMRRVGSATGRAIYAFSKAICEMPIHCFRCQREFTFADHELSVLHDIPKYQHRIALFCRDCVAIIYAEYRYHCAWCGNRHNLADSPICADCQACQYPREARRVAEHNMRALEHGAAATLTVPEWLRTLEDWNWSCYWCKRPFEALDHFIPLALGGGTTAENCFPICRRCNSMKGAFHPDDLLLPSPRSPEAHRIIRDYQKTRWPQLPSTIPSAMEDIVQLQAGESVDL